MPEHEAAGGDPAPWGRTASSVFPASPNFPATELHLLPSWGSLSFTLCSICLVANTGDRDNAKLDGDRGTPSNGSFLVVHSYSPVANALTLGQCNPNIHMDKNEES